MVDDNCQGYASLQSDPYARHTRDDVHVQIIFLDGANTDGNPILPDARIRPLSHFFDKAIYVGCHPS